jgi:hypothetical protein
MRRMPRWTCLDWAFALVVAAAIILVISILLYYHFHS